MSAPAKKKSNFQQEKIPAITPQRGLSAVIEGLGRVFLRFERFGRDVLGISLLVICLISLLALLGLTAGSFISPWGDFLKRWIGIGSYMVVGLTGYGGALILRRNTGGDPALKLGLILAIESIVFAFLALFAIVGGLSLERAEAGLDGGIIGWGLARLTSMLLPLPWSTIAILLFILWLAGVILGLGGWLVKQLEKWLASEPRHEVLAQAPLPETANPPDGNPAIPDSPTGGIPIPVVSGQREDNLPPITFLSQEQTNGLDEERILAIANKIETTLAEFSIPSRVIGYRVGPTVTQFAVEPGFVERIGQNGVPFNQKVRVNQISGLSRDLALALAVERLRIEAPVPGHSYIGIEVPNTNTTLVRLRSVLESDEFHRLESPLAIALGRDVSGQPVAADLARMPHLLVAGTTGSGKSVCLAAIITCLVMNNSPKTLRLAILDPKMVELVRFNGLPHLLGKVETEIDRMLAVLRWALVEMEQRYRVLEAANTRDIDTFNRKIKRHGQSPLPRIVIIIDELADLMMTAPDQTEHSLVRLAQMARATGIHLVIATQRPSTDVVTGLIKANFPSRIAFSVASSIDSRVILDVNGAESLLGRGDMLFLNPEVGSPLRSQGVMLRDQEVNRVVGFWQREIAIKEVASPWEELVDQGEPGGDDLIEDAIELVRKTQRASASLLQRRMRIGFPRAARLLDELEEMGIVGPSPGGGKDREVLIDPDEEKREDAPDEDDS